MSTNQSYYYGYDKKIKENLVKKQITESEKLLCYKIIILDNQVLEYGKPVRRNIFVIYLVTTNSYDHIERLDQLYPNRTTGFTERLDPLLLLPRCYYCELLPILPLLPLLPFYCFVAFIVTTLRVFELTMRATGKNNTNKKEGKRQRKKARERMKNERDTTHSPKSC